MSNFISTGDLTQIWVEYKAFDKASVILLYEDIHFVRNIVEETTSYMIVSSKISNYNIMLVLLIFSLKPINTIKIQVDLQTATCIRLALWHKSLKMPFDSGIHKYIAQNSTSLIYCGRRRNTFAGHYFFALEAEIFSIRPLEIFGREYSKLR